MTNQNLLWVQTLNLYILEFSQRLKYSSWFTLPIKTNVASKLNFNFFGYIFVSIKIRQSEAQPKLKFFFLKKTISYEFAIGLLTISYEFAIGLCELTPALILW